MSDSSGETTDRSVLGTGSTRSASARSAAWSTAAFVSIGVSQILLQRILDRYLTIADFGVVTATLVVISFGKIFTMSGVGPAIVQRKDLERRHIETGFLLSMLMGCAAVIVLFATAPLIARLFNAPTLEGVMRMMSFTFLIQAVGIPAEGLLQRDLRFKELAVAEIASIVTGFIGVGIGTAMAGAGVYSLVWANLAQSVIKVALVIRATRHPIGLRFDRPAARDLIRFASGFTLAKIGNNVAVSGGNIVVGNRLGDVALGQYGKAYQLLAMPAMLFGQVIDRVLFPTMARIQDDKDRLAVIYRRGVAAIATVTGPGGALIVVLAPEMIYLLAGPGEKWQPAIMPLRIFGASLVLRTGYKISDSLARSSGNVFKRAKRQWIYAAAVIGFSLVGAATNGINGAAVGGVAALLLNYLLMADLSLRTTGLSWLSFADAHRRGAILGLFTAAISVGIASMLRHQGAHYIVVLVATAVGVAMMFGALIKVRRDLVLGDVDWLLRGRRTSTPSTPITGDAPEAVAL